jgi:Uncharacterised nucleotidyltransferase
MSTAEDLVSRALRQPMRLAGLDAAHWELLVRQARRAALLARIGCILDAQGALDAVPPAPRAHLVAAMTLAEAQHAEALRELRSISAILSPIGVRAVLLKGAAYVAAGLLPSMGRSFGDIDLLVPKPRLPAVEAALMAQGWATTHHTPYDQRYYRDWMHELPPLRHIQRQTVLDVHHAILPPTARLKPSSDRLIAAARGVPGDPAFAVLSPTDMVLHGMTHLLHNEEFSHGLRDLSDLDLLLRQFGNEAGFWDSLISRARELQLARPLYYGLRYTQRLLGTPVPTDVACAADGLGPAGPLRTLSDALWVRVLRPQHETVSLHGAGAARLALYLRSHWLRMPPMLLVRHVTVKALRLHLRTTPPAAA